MTNLERLFIFGFNEGHPNMSVGAAKLDNS